MRPHPTPALDSIPLLPEKSPPKTAGFYFSG